MALHEAILENPEAVCVFLDMKAAYDCVNRKILWRDMSDSYGFKPHIVTVCRSLFDDNRSILLVNGVKSNEIRCRRGLLQGSAMAPILFNIYINQLLVRLEHAPKLTIKGVPVNNLFFADDGALIGKDRSAVQGLCDICTKWADEYGAQFAPHKCEALHRMTNNIATPLQIQSGIIPYVDRVVYLGLEVTMATGICFTKKYLSRCAAMIDLAKFMCRKGMNAYGWRANCRVSVFKSFLRPMIEYGIMFMSRSDLMLAKAEKCQNYALNMLMSSARTTSRGAKMKVLNIESMSFRREKLQFLFVKKLALSGPDASIAASIYHSKAKPQAVIKKMVSRNPIYNVFVKSTVSVKDNSRPAEKKSKKKSPLDTILEMRKAKSMEQYDSNKNGRRDMAASIGTILERKHSVYTDAVISKDDQIAISQLRIGAYTFHQACNTCDSVTTREHALECSGESERLRERFPRHYATYTATDDESTMFHDYLLNRLDLLYARDRQHAEVEALSTELFHTAKVIREVIAGFVKGDNGKWIHPSRLLAAKKRRVFKPP
jgi:hypothetical protein